jgi:hypothetical protein
MSEVSYQNARSNAVARCGSKCPRTSAAVGDVTICCNERPRISDAAAADDAMPRGKPAVYAERAEWGWCGGEEAAAVAGGPQQPRSKTLKTSANSNLSCTLTTRCVAAQIMFCSPASQRVHA